METVAVSASGRSQFRPAGGLSFPHSRYALPCGNMDSPQWRYRLGVRTPDSQSGNPGSIPGTATKLSLHTHTSLITRPRRVSHASLRLLARLLPRYLRALFARFRKSDRDRLLAAL